MKALIATFLIVFAANFAQAQTPVGGLTPFDLTINLADDTQVVVLDLKTINGVSCPGALDLQSNLYSDGVAEITYKNDGNKALMEMMKKVSKSCGEEIFEEMVQGPIAICLSFGFETGSVLLDVRHLSGDELTIKLPSNITTTGITQL